MTVVNTISVRVGGYRTVFCVALLSGLVGGTFACAGAPTLFDRPPKVAPFRDGRFSNPQPIEPPGVFAIAAHILTGRNGYWPGPREIEERLREQVAAPSERPQMRVDLGVRVTWIGHATLLVQGAGVNVLTDPVWSRGVGPWSFLGPQRAYPPGVRWEDLPRIDLVVVSHNHFDHMDLPTLRRISARDRPWVLVPLGNAVWLRRQGVERVIELDWWESWVDPKRDHLRVTLTPAQHNSGRGLFDANRTLWGSYWLSLGKHRVYFAGDTSYSGHFVEVRSRMGRPDVALLPIGAYEPREKMQKFHLDPADAVQANLDLAAHHSIAMHFGTFQLTGEDFDEPARDLAASLSSRGVTPGEFVVPVLGQPLGFDLEIECGRSNCDQEAISASDKL